MRASAHAIRSSLRRCPACGQRVKPPLPARCPLCDFDFRDDRVTGVDVTPYAKAYSLGQSGWQRMFEWVWFAGRERLKHLALMRASAASRRFALLNILLLAAGLGLFQTTLVGWRWVTRLPAIEPTGSTEPGSPGWIHLAAAPRPLPPDQAPEVPVDLWWNPAQSVLGAVTAGTAGLIAMWLVLLLVRAGARWAHIPSYRKEGRMTAAMHYSTAWGIPIFVGAIVLGLSPASFAGTMAQWWWCPPQRVFVLAAAVLAGFGMTMWWFWLGRLGATAPARTRGRVIAFLAIGPPLIVALAAAGWWWGLRLLYDPLFRMWNLAF